MRSLHLKGGPSDTATDPTPAHATPTQTDSLCAAGYRPGSAHAEPRPSDVLWSEPFPPHSVENVGDAELRVIMVELKDHR
jgi:hypothetical protein